MTGYPDIAEHVTAKKQTCPFTEQQDAYLRELIVEGISAYDEEAMGEILKAISALREEVNKARAELKAMMTREVADTTQCALDMRVGRA